MPNGASLLACAFADAVGVDPNLARMVDFHWEKGRGRLLMEVVCEGEDGKPIIEDGAIKSLLKTFREVNDE